MRTHLGCWALTVACRCDVARGTAADAANPATLVQPASNAPDPWSALDLPVVQRRR
jgi:hypothetical protein